MYGGHRLRTLVGKTRITLSMNTKMLVDKIAALVKERISAESVVSLNDMRSATKIKKKISVLVVEDDESLRKALVRILELDGYEVVQAESANELIKVFDRGPFDMILLDVGLPWINGYELAEMLRGHEAFKKVPFVFVTAAQDIDSMKKGFAVGAHDYIVKPFDIEVVRKTVKTILALV